MSQLASEQTVPRRPLDSSPADTSSRPSYDVLPLFPFLMADPEAAAEASGDSPETGIGKMSFASTSTKRHAATAAAAKSTVSSQQQQQSSSGSLSPGHVTGSVGDSLLVRRNSKDKLDNITGFGEVTAQRRSSSSSSIRSRRCSGDSVRQIVQLASIKETINSNRSSQDELESLIQAKLSQCRVIFDFLDDPLSDLKYKVSSSASS